MTRTGRRRHVGTGLAEALGQLRSDGAIATVTVIAVFLCGSFLTVAPLLIDRWGDEALLEAVSTPEPQLRNLSASVRDRLDVGPRDDPFEEVRERGVVFQQTQMTPSVRSLVSNRTWVADSPQFFVAAMPDAEEQVLYSSGRYAGTLMTLRYQSDVAENVVLRAGNLPRPADPTLVEIGRDCEQGAGDGDAAQRDCSDRPVPVFEVAVTQETLDLLPIDVGGSVLLSPDFGHEAYLGVAREDLDYHLVLRVSGLIEIPEPELDYWYNDPRLLRPRFRSNADFTFVFATSLMSPDDYDRLLGATRAASWRYEWRYFVEPERVSEHSAGGLIADLSQLEQQFDVSTNLEAGGIGLNTKLSELLAEYLERRDTTVALMSMSGAGLVILTSSLVLVLGALTAERQRPALLLLRGRGASWLQLSASRLLQGLLLVVAPVGLALVIAHAALGWNSATPARLALVLAVAVVSAFVVTPLLVVRSQDRAGSPPAVKGPTKLTRRDVVELTIAVAAGAALVIVRRRGLVGVAGRRPDLLLAVTPALLAVASAAVALRIYPRLMSVASALGSRRRGLTIFVGFRRVGGQTTSTHLPLLALLLALAVATFAMASRSSVRSAQLDASWHEVGASHRISEPDPAVQLTGSVGPDVLASFEAHAAGLRFTFARTQPQPGIPAILDVLLLDGGGYADVSSGTPVGVDFPSFMLDDGPPAAGTADDPIPAISLDPSLGRGEVFTAVLSATSLSFEIRDVRSEFPTMPLDRAGVIADIRHTQLIRDPVPTDPTVIWVRASADDTDRLAAVVAQTTLSGELTSQHQVLADLRSDHFASGLDRTLVAATAVAIAIAALTALSSVANASPTRARDYAYLRTQGLSRSQASRLTAIEHVPMLIVAVGIGTACGVLIHWLLSAAVDLTAFTAREAGDRGAILNRGIVGVAFAVLLGLVVLSAVFAAFRQRAELDGRVEEQQYR